MTNMTIDRQERYETAKRQMVDLLTWTYEDAKREQDELMQRIADIEASINDTNDTDGD